MSANRVVGTVVEISPAAGDHAWVSLDTGGDRIWAWRTEDMSTARRVQDRVGVGDRVTLWLKSVGPHYRITAIGPAPDDDEKRRQGWVAPVLVALAGTVVGAVGGLVVGPLPWW